jgi:hypothetical protein
VLPAAKSKDKAMITDAKSQGALIAALHLESLFDAGRLVSVGEKSNRATHVRPAIHFSNNNDAAQLRHRLAFIQRLAVRAQGLSFRTDTTSAASPGKSDAATSRAAARVAAWRTYLPEDCVVAMINSGWHWS